MKSSNKIQLAIFFSFFAKAVSATQITVDGSSTVLPILEALAEEYGKAQPGVRITVGTSGTGGGFKKFCAGEIDVSNASRPVKPSEVEACKKNGIKFIELPIAYDGITLVVSKKNTFVDCLKVSEIQKIWGPNSEVKNWNQIAPAFPNQPIRLFGPGADSGTFDYFTETINGKEDLIRKDFTASEDDNVLVKGVSASDQTLGYFGFAYYLANQAKLKAVKVDSGSGCVEPSLKTIQEGKYSPLSRPLFIYISDKSLQKPGVESFVNWSLKNAGPLVDSVGFVSLTPALYETASNRLKSRILNSIFINGAHLAGEKSLEALYRSQKK